MAKRKSATSTEASYLATFSDYQETFNTKAGRKVLRHLMKVHGIMQRSYVEGDAYATAFNEGGRNAVIQILNKLRVDLKELENHILEQPEGDDDVII